jgi:hypothetical protein
LYLNAEGINNLLKELDQDTKALKEELLRMCWYMRGGLTYTESYLLDSEERQLIGKIIEGNLETTKETSLPFF